MPPLAVPHWVTGVKVLVLVVFLWRMQRRLSARLLLQGMLVSGSAGCFKECSVLCGVDVGCKAGLLRVSCVFLLLAFEFL